MARSDFNWVPIGHYFTVLAPTVTKRFPIEGDQMPVDDAYLLVQASHVSLNTHKIFINNKELPNSDIPVEGGSQTWMDHIPPRFLKLGPNTVRIDRVGDDDFYINALVVNWRE